MVDEAVLELVTISFCLMVKPLRNEKIIGGGFKYFLFSSLFGEKIQFD